MEIGSVCGPTKPESRGKLAPRATPLRGVLSGQPRLLPRFKGEFARLALRDSAGLEHTRRQRPESGPSPRHSWCPITAPLVCSAKSGPAALDVGDYWTSTDGSAWRGVFEHLRRWFRLPRKFVDRLVGDAEKHKPSTSSGTSADGATVSQLGITAENQWFTEHDVQFADLDHKAYVEAFPLCPPLTTRLPVVKAIRDAELLARDQLGLKENQIWVLRIRNIKHTPRISQTTKTSPSFTFKSSVQIAIRRRAKCAHGQPADWGKPEQMIQSIGNEAPEEEILEYLDKLQFNPHPCKGVLGQTFDSFKPSSAVSVLGDLRMMYSTCALSDDDTEVRGQTLDSELKLGGERPRRRGRTMQLTGTLSDVDTEMSGESRGVSLRTTLSRLSQFSDLRRGAALGFPDNPATSLRSE